MTARKLILFSLLIPFSIACQRKSSDDNQMLTSISINMPTSTSQAVSASDLEHVVINISGPGMDTLSQTWSKKGGGGIGSANSLPTFSFDVPQGTDRLIQALGVYKDASTGSLDFYYGEVVQSISVSDIAIAVSISKVGSSSGLEGQINGRYTASDNTNPTGLLSVVFTPPGRNPLIIMQTPMISGWFNAFALNDQEFDYLLNGVSIFGGSKKIPDFTTMGPNVAVVKIPGYYHSTHNGSIPYYEPARAEIRGAFGANTTASKICYKDTSSTISGYIDASWYVTNPSYPLVSNSPTYITYSPGGSFSPTGSLVTVSGGVNYNSYPTPCGGLGFNKWTSMSSTVGMYINPDYSYPSYPSFSNQISGALNTDMSMSVTVPNVSFPSQYDYSLSWSYLPGITSSNYTNELFVMTYDAFDYLAYDGHNSVNCDKITNYIDANGSVYVAGDLKVKRIGFYTSPSATVQYASIPATMVTSPLFLICPKSNSTSEYLPGTMLRY